MLKKPLRFAAIALAAALPLLNPLSAAADNWPSRPVKLVVPFPPGGAADAIGRYYADKLSKALREMGFKGKHATHGFRGTLRTMARERLGIDLDVLEAQLAHAKRGDVAKAYDRTTFDDQRIQVMQAWADYLDTVRRNEDNVVPLKKAG